MNRGNAGRRAAVPEIMRNQVRFLAAIAATAMILSVLAGAAGGAL
jgi:hypothetical protein